ncbi:MAG: ROK family protein [Solirubrobacterales bacterium]|nr:ROK family protein [Solirubrobacterales bacterium]
MTVIGIDLGGTKVAAAWLGDDGLSHGVEHPTKLGSSEELLDQLTSVVNETRGDSEIDAVGIGVPSIVESASGRVVSSTNIPLKDVPLRAVLGERLGVPVFVDNDATVAALAEAHDESLTLVSQNLVMLTIGTGVGGGIVIGGRIYRGATGGAGELGHTIVGLDLAGAVPKPMSFAQPGSLEWVASGHSLDRLAEQAANLHPESPLGRLQAEGKPVLGPEVVAAAERGDTAATRIVEIWGQHVGVGVANAINTFDPEEVVIGGGAARAGELLLGPARQVAANYVFPGLWGHTNIRLARFGANAGVVGAALLAVHELEQPSIRVRG